MFDFRNCQETCFSRIWSFCIGLPWFWPFRWSSWLHPEFWKSRWWCNWALLQNQRYFTFSYFSILHSSLDSSANKEYFYLLVSSLVIYGPVLFFFFSFLHLGSEILVLLWLFLVYHLHLYWYLTTHLPFPSRQTRVPCPSELFIWSVDGWGCSFEGASEAT